MESEKILRDNLRDKFLAWFDKYIIAGFKSK